MNRTLTLGVLTLIACTAGCGSRSSRSSAPAAPRAPAPDGQQAGPLPAFGASARPTGVNGVASSGSATRPTAAPAVPAPATTLGATPAPSPPAPTISPTTPPPAVPPAAFAPDRDGDGLSDAAEATLGTDPDLPDTDGDGILDGADLAPRFAGYGAFAERFPAGAVRRGLDVDVLGLGGSARIESWLGTWNTEYQGPKGTRSSVFEPADVQRRVEASLAGGAYELEALGVAGPETTAPALPAPAPRKRFGRRSTFRGTQPGPTQPRQIPEGPAAGTGHRTRTQVLGKRYTIDYAYRLAPHQAQLRNRTPLAVRDRAGQALANHTFAVLGEAGLQTDVVLQARTQGPVSGRYAVLFTVLDGPDPRRARLALESQVALGAPLGPNAFEVRLPMPAARRTTTWTVVAVPVLLSEVGGEVRIAAIEAGEVRLGAAARVETLGGGSAVQRITVVSNLAALAQPSPPALGVPNVVERKTLSRAGDVWRATRTVIETRRRLGGRTVVIETRTRSSWTQGPDLLALLAPADARRFGSLLAELARWDDGFAVLEARRAVLARRALDGTIEATVHALQRGLLDGPLQRLASLELIPARLERLRGLLDRDAVLRGLRGVQAAAHLFDSVRAFADGDPLQGGLYLGRLGADTLGVLGKADQARLLGGILGGAQGFLSAQRAFAAGDHALGLVQVARGSGALVEHLVRVPGVDVSGLVKVALGGVDVAYQLHQADLERDAIRRQARVERAVSAAIDTGVGLIPTVGVAVQAAWSIGFLVATVLDPDLMQWEQVLGSPGSVLTLLGTALFTNEIPSAVSEVAFSGASEGLVERARELQREGRTVIVILPEVLSAERPTPPAAAPAKQPPAAGPGKDRRRNRRGSRRSKANATSSTSSTTTASAPAATSRGSRGTRTRPTPSTQPAASPATATSRPRAGRRRATSSNSSTTSTSTASPKRSGGAAAARSRRGSRR